MKGSIISELIVSAVSLMISGQVWTNAGPVCEQRAKEGNERRELIAAYLSIVSQPGSRERDSSLGPFGSKAHLSSFGTNHFRKL